ncbi:unnamed protein product [Ilex paraguariensis]|uniref:Chalcone-flavonone isomerase family protein n=1 Tax=Ilex paraguariensis TaxID=185542 RepID=A0ABC8U655_9AQUA
MSPSPSVTGVQVESYVFPPTVKPPGSTKTLFLGGAGARGLEIGGKFVKFTAIGVYLADNAVSSLAVNWKGKTTEELTESVEFFRDIVTGAFEKFIKVTMILPLTGKQYSEKISFSIDDTIPDVGNATIENKQLSEAVLESIIGKHGVSPEAKQSLAVRISELLNQNDNKADDRAVGQCKCGDH